jgi:hypothetical protein
MQSEYGATPPPRSARSGGLQYELWGMISRLVWFYPNAYAVCGGAWH